MSGHCVDCGRATSGIRCRPCNGKHIALEAALELAQRDNELLAEGISGDRLAERLNISKPAAYRRIADAKRRQEFLRQHRRTALAEAVRSPLEA